MNQETKKLDVSETIIPETQTQHPGKLLSHVNTARRTNEYKVNEKIFELEKSNIQANRESSEKEITKEVISVEPDMDTSNISESPSILSLKCRPQKCSQDLSESPSILSGNKCMKKISSDLHTCGDSDTLSIFNIERPFKDMPSTSLNSLEHSLDQSLNTDANLEATRLPSYSKSDAPSVECKENTAFIANNDTHLNEKCDKPEENPLNDNSVYKSINPIIMNKGKAMNINQIKPLIFTSTDI